MFSVLVDRAPAEVFRTILDVASWWSGIYGESLEGESKEVGDEFIFQAGAGAHYSKQKMTECVPNEKVAWLVTESRLSFLADPGEWKGTKIRFDLSREKNKTKVVFTHIGLVAELECYQACAPGWTRYLEERLVKLIDKH